MEITVANKKGEKFSAQISPCDLELFKAQNWCVALTGPGRRPYLMRCEYDPIKKTRKTIYFHRETMCPPSGRVVDHINGNSLDNRRENMRVCTISENKMNSRRYKNNVSGCPGVNKRGDRYRVTIGRGGKRFFVGSFKSLAEAIDARMEAVKSYHGKFARA